MKKILLIFTAGLFLWACNPSKNSTEVIEMNSPLTNSVWQLIEINQQPVTTSFIKKPYLLFSDSSKVHGFLGCNLTGGVYTEGANSGLSFGNMWSTKMACEAMDLEDKFSKVLTQVAYYTISNDTLMMQDKNKMPIAVFLSRADLDQVQ